MIDPSGQISYLCEAVIRQHHAGPLRPHAVVAEKNEILFRIEVSDPVANPSERHQFRPFNTAELILIRLPNVYQTKLHARVPESLQFFYCDVSNHVDIGPRYARRSSSIRFVKDSMSLRA